MGLGAVFHPLAISPEPVPRVPAVRIDREPRLFFSSVLLGRHNLLAAVETVRADVVTAVHFTGTGFNGGCRIGEEVVSAVIAALAGRFLILLNSHFLNTPRGLKVNF